MKEIAEKYIAYLFQRKGISVPPEQQALFNKFVHTEANIDLAVDIIDKQDEIMKNWKLENRINDISHLAVVIPNARAGESYSATLNLEKLNLADLIILNLEIPQELGLSFENKTNSIAGTPLISGDFNLKLIYRLKEEEEEIEDEPVRHEKIIPLIVNPDPKTLWKNIPSDQNLPFAKPDFSSRAGRLGDKNIIAASKRGRSHQHSGSFRDDEFAFAHIDESGWSIVAVADGAGSYSLSREGSRLACEAIIEYFQTSEELDSDADFEKDVLYYSKTRDRGGLDEARKKSIAILYKATVYAHNRLNKLAQDTRIAHFELYNNPKAKNDIDYFHTTLAFAMYKKYDFGFLILSFGVGDCPIAVINEAKTQTTLLNKLDVGEFGGGTRFITQREIFHSQDIPMQTRFNFHVSNNFSALILMTDGVYDPKFEVEANLSKHERWLAFLDDLNGNNEDHVAVPLDPEVTPTDAEPLLQWLDFWDKGNHDDRTIAIVY
jgi:serine/threonine protein phosphatase PrpC